MGGGRISSWCTEGVNPIRSTPPPPPPNNGSGRRAPAVHHSSIRHAAAHRLQRWGCAGGPPPQAARPADGSGCSRQTTSAAAHCLPACCVSRHQASAPPQHCGLGQREKPLPSGRKRGRNPPFQGGRPSAQAARRGLQAPLCCHGVLDLLQSPGGGAEALQVEHPGAVAQAGWRGGGQLRLPPPPPQQGVRRTASGMSPQQQAPRHPPDWSEWPGLLLPAVRLHDCCGQAQQGWGGPSQGSVRRRIQHPAAAVRRMLSWCAPWSAAAAVTGPGTASGPRAAEGAARRGWACVSPRRRRRPPMLKTM